MSRHSAKTAGRSAKTAGRSAKKTTKAARATVKKASKTGRRPAGKNARSAPATPKRAAPAIVPAAAAMMMIRTASPPMQPVQPELPVRAHKYKVGEVVYYTSPSFGRASASGNYTVVKLLPSEGDDYQYRIKSSGEAFERVAKESQLDKG